MAAQCGSEKQLIVPLVNKDWWTGAGGGGGYGPDWVGPAGYGRTVAPVGLVLAPVPLSTTRLQQVASSPSLVSVVDSSVAAHTALVSLLGCMDLACCRGSIASATGIPTRSGRQDIKMPFMKGNISGTATWAEIQEMSGF
jgi:hypothetical protein